MKMGGSSRFLIQGAPPSRLNAKTYYHKHNKDIKI